MNFASALRHELAVRALKYAESKALRHSLSYGEMPAICFLPHEHQFHHGNFAPASYRAIVSNPVWRQRLDKVHTHGRRSLPPKEGGRWRELDSCNSSDALLMNIFCHPGILRRGRLLAMLGLDTAVEMRFGYKARVPLVSGKYDRTEVDLRIGNLLVEAKLTEGDFQKAEKKVMSAYRDFFEVFDGDALPQIDGHYVSYQLLRNVLAAHALQCSLCVLLDGRRLDLREAWYAVMKCVRPVGLRTALKLLTWQELAATLPFRLQTFLEIKYGIFTS